MKILKNFDKKVRKKVRKSPKKVQKKFEKMIVKKYPQECSTEEFDKELKTVLQKKFDLKVRKTIENKCSMKVRPESQSILHIFSTFETFKSKYHYKSIE